MARHLSLQRTLAAFVRAPGRSSLNPSSRPLAPVRSRARNASLDFKPVPGRPRSATRGQPRAGRRGIRAEKNCRRSSIPIDRPCGIPGIPTIEARGRRLLRRRTRAPANASKNPAHSWEGSSLPGLAFSGDVPWRIARLRLTLRGPASVSESSGQSERRGFRDKALSRLNGTLGIQAVLRTAFRNYDDESA